jgi:hypothetical protein
MLALRERSGQRLFDTGEERTLDEAVTTVWTKLSERGQGHCLVCGGSATLSDDLEGRSSVGCRDCGATLE